ncbi:hypothetical protein SY27_15330 [Flavobacterium sp. 316]|uniref:YceI family protein n=1 Tax=Flavobacterium sp. 316 TaxID=1603293 RepID=UPI0005DDF4C6|nr:YceI family protein [Flavobacterium sp. 316]KIX19902.1 hypothetical protein SY27_15330 [Flavobacterium sp. 316]
MKKNILSLALITIISLTGCKKETTTEETVTPEPTVETVDAITFNIDNASSSVAWIGSKPTGKHNGTITVKEGNFDVIDGKVSGGTFVMDMNSITVTDLEGDDKLNLETHLKGTGDKEAEDHFFNTAKFPTSTFKINSITETDGVSTVNGTLTMKDISKEVSFPAKISITDSEVSLVSEPFKINRTLWGVNYASKSIFDDLKDKFVDDEIELTVTAKATK